MDAMLEQFVLNDNEIEMVAGAGSTFQKVAGAIGGGLIGAAGGSVVGAVVGLVCAPLGVAIVGASIALGGELGSGNW